MSKVDFKLNGAGVRELLRSEEAAAVCLPYAQRVYSAASSSADGYVLERRNYPERSGYAVYAGDYPAIADNLNNNTLLKSLGGGK